jgi:predicted secreted acid phosphatase
MAYFLFDLLTPWPVELYKVKSNDEIAAMLKSQLMCVAQKTTKKGPKGAQGKGKTGISKYLSEETSSEDEDEFDNNDELNTLDKTIMNNDKEQLIDIELVNLLKYCQELFDKYKHNNESYSEEIMLKSIELGKKTKQKLLILDMDETMISAKFKSKLPEGF